jgi:DNA polymerase (family 10)
VNWAELFKIALDTGTALEINSQPLRLDLTDELVKAAIEAGVTLTISTDAHALSQFSYMQLGIAVARRGFAEKSDVLNTLSWKQIESFKKKKLKKLGLP